MVGLDNIKGLFQPNQFYDSSSPLVGMEMTTWLHLLLTRGVSGGLLRVVASFLGWLCSLAVWEQHQLERFPTLCPKSVLGRGPPTLA